jgi:hypothetical protein
MQGNMGVKIGIIIITIFSTVAVTMAISIWRLHRLQSKMKSFLLGIVSSSDFPVHVIWNVISFLFSM